MITIKTTRAGFPDSTQQFDGQKIRIGRDDDNDLVLQALVEVSQPEHEALIEKVLIDAQVIARVLLGLQIRITDEKIGTEAETLGEPGPLLAGSHAAPDTCS